jgi:hypothetical protein
MNDAAPPIGWLVSPIARHLERRPHCEFLLANSLAHTTSLPDTLNTVGREAFRRGCLPIGKAEWGHQGSRTGVAAYVYGRRWWFSSARRRTDHSFVVPRRCIHVDCPFVPLRCTFPTPSAYCAARIVDSSGRGDLNSLRVLCSPSSTAMRDAAIIEMDIRSSSGHLGEFIRCP